MDDAEDILQDARALTAAGDPQGARARLGELTGLPLTKIQPLLVGAFAAFQMGDMALAEQLSRRAIEVRPEAPFGHLNLGNVFESQGRMAEAEESIRTAIAKAPDHAPAHANLGRILELMRRPDEAEAAYRRALELTSDDPALHDALGRTLGKQARYEEAIAAFRQVLAIQRDYAPAALNIGNVHQNAEDLEKAEDAYRRALRMDRNLSAARINLALVLQRRGDLVQAERELRTAAEQVPDDATVWINLAAVLYERGDADVAARTCDKALSLDPGNRTALAFKAVALAEAGEAAAAREIIDLERFVNTRQIDCPPGYASLEAFNAALFDQVSAVPDRFSEPGTEKGRQTRELMNRPDGALAAYRDFVDRAVSEYMAALGDDPLHPFVATRPAAWDLSAWGTITRVIDDGEDTHFHPTAWLSGVYYCQLPQEIAAGDGAGDQGGWIELGRPPNHIRHGFEPVLQTIRPRPGLLVLFPSYFYHRVLPFTATAERMSVAFDAIPRT